MRFARIIFCILVILVTGTAAWAQTKRIVIAASTVLDGKGHTLHNTRIVIEGSKIVAIDTNVGPEAGPVDYDLRGLTVLPGWIDAHVHVTWSFGKDGKNAGPGGTTQESAYQAASNAWVTLMAGFSTPPKAGGGAGSPLRAGLSSSAAHRPPR